MVVGVRAAAASCKTLKEMNPMVTINTASGTVDKLTDAALAEFHVVLMGGGSLHDQAALNARCRKLGTCVRLACPAHRVNTTSHTHHPARVHISARSPVRLLFRSAAGTLLFFPPFHPLGLHTHSAG